MLVRAASANSARKPTSEPSVISAPSIRAANTPPTSATGSVAKASTASRQPRNGGLQQQEDRDQAARCRRRCIWPVPISPPVVCFSTSAWYSSGKLASCEAVLDVARDRVEAAPADVGLDVEVARDLVALDRQRRLHDPHVGHLAEAHVAAARAVEQQVADVRDAARACSGVALDDHVEHLLVLEHAADRDALQQGRLRATHVARLDLVARALSRSTSISTCGCVAGCATRGSTTPSTCDDQLPHPLRLRGAGRPAPGRRRARRAACRCRSARRGRCRGSGCRPR